MNVLSKSYIDDINNGILTGEHKSSGRIFEIAIQTSFWISTRSRILERFYMKTSLEDGTPINLMCPQPIIFGTVSGRQTENLFLVLCGTKRNKIASEAKTRIQAPEGYKIVG